MSLYDKRLQRDELCDRLDFLWPGTVTRDQLSQAAIMTHNLIIREDLFPMESKQ